MTELEHGIEFIFLSEKADTGNVIYGIYIYI